MEDFCDNFLESLLNVGRVEGRGLNEGKTVLLSKLLGLLGGNLTQMPQIALVADEHDDDVGSGVLPKLTKPALNVLEGGAVGNVAHQKSSDGSAVVRAGDCAITLLASWNINK